MTPFRLTAAAAARRRFLQRGAAAGAALGAGPLLLACGGGNAAVADAAGSGRDAEPRTYFFDFSKEDQEADFYLVSGNTHHKLKALTPDEITSARGTTPLLAQVPLGNVTHGGIDLPLGKKMRMCFVKVRRKSHKSGQWDMHSMFFHMPKEAAVAGAVALSAGCGPCAQAPLALSIGLPTDKNDCNVPADDPHRDFFDAAVALVCHHPEILSAHSGSMAYIQQYIICPDVNTLALAKSIEAQGPASTVPGGWATLVECIDPVTKLPKLASNGDVQYFVHHSKTTHQATGKAIQSVLKTLKNDPKLGADITGMKAGDDTSGLRGAKWTTRAGKPDRGVVQSASQASTTTAWTVTDVSSMPGYHAILDVTPPTIGINVLNWYDRFLGLYVRFLDLSGNPIPLSTLDLQSLNFPVSTLSKTYDAFLDMISPELVVLGVPLQSAFTQYTLNLPPGVSSVILIAGGAGHGTDLYPDLNVEGASLTAFFNLAVPGLFLMVGAASSIAPLTEEVAQQGAQAMIALTKLIVTAVGDQMVEGAFDDPSLLTNLLPALLGLLVSGGKLAKLIYNNEVLGEETEVADDCAPFGIGLLINALIAAGTAAGIAETAAEIRLSPDNYVTQALYSHNLTVTINPQDLTGFPGTATYYTVSAAVGTATPLVSANIPINPVTQGSQPIAFQFTTVPAGGLAQVEFNMYAADDTLRATGTATVDNTRDFATITVTNIAVKLTPDTIYTHSLVLTPVGGNLAWQSGPQAPEDSRHCTAAAGSLCELLDLTINDTLATLAYTFRSYVAPRDFANAPSGQIYSLQLVGTGSASTFIGFAQPTTSPMRVAFDAQTPLNQAYYVDMASGRPMVRLVLLGGSGGIETLDNAQTGFAFGAFNLKPDIVVQHPSGKLVAINRDHNRFEVLTPSPTRVVDALAPLASIVSGTGTRAGRISGATCAAVTRSGVILVLESGTNRIQAFDTGGNLVKYFKGAATLPLQTSADSPSYLDLAVERKGYLYALWEDPRSGIVNMDVYKPDGYPMFRVRDMRAQKIAVDRMRTVFTLNRTVMPNPSNFSLTQPTLSQWFPS